ncbi:ClpXP protease specificity-enhancing factor [Thermomonas aquatica]|uniref:ClpXP protease specificity-enhancing factor n=1 Tax=Thermomonas aquatica TaxID=2202149 RepID=A0A5B7ZTW0_9GAMM|nr:ClpXP protease specificity-enhancing factor [Thermomonas aquatica]QDA58075.1 ClpXP protease specificity-enhancing factor [Thermomonas aquatica]
MGDDALQMTSHRPYLLRALYEWIVDNGMTPHVLVDAGMPGVRVPMQSVKDGRIVLNIAERAVGGLRMDNDALRFSARFGGVSQSVLVPLEAVIAVYARETGQGMALPDDPRGAAAPMAAAASPASESEAPAPDDDGPDGPHEPPRRGGHLRIVK